MAIFYEDSGWQCGLVVQYINTCHEEIGVNNLRVITKISVFILFLALVVGQGCEELFPGSASNGSGEDIDNSDSGAGNGDWYSGLMASVENSVTTISKINEIIDQLTSGSSTTENTRRARRRARLGLEACPSVMEQECTKGVGVSKAVYSEGCMLDYLQVTGGDSYDQLTFFEAVESKEPSCPINKNITIGMVIQRESPVEATLPQLERADLFFDLLSGVTDKTFRIQEDETLTYQSDGSWSLDITKSSEIVDIGDNGSETQWMKMTTQTTSPVFFSRPDGNAGETIVTGSWTSYHTRIDFTATYTIQEGGLVFQAGDCDLPISGTLQVDFADFTLFPDLAYATVTFNGCDADAILVELFYADGEPVDPSEFINN